MIDLLSEAENHLELYREACGAEAVLENRKWKERFFLGLPTIAEKKGLQNPINLKRALLLVARWYLYHSGASPAVEKTVDDLDEWYRTITQFAMRSKSVKQPKLYLDRLEGFSDDYRKTESFYRNMDKVNYYRLACQAIFDGPMEHRDIVIPPRILKAWKEHNISSKSRGVCILFHYLGHTPGVTKGEINLWLQGNGSYSKDDYSPKSVDKGSANEVSPYGVSVWSEPVPSLPPETVQPLHLLVGEKLTWSEEECQSEGAIHLKDQPWMARFLSDEALGEAEKEQRPELWLGSELEEASIMLEQYRHKKDLAAQNAKTGTKKRVRNRFFLGLLYTLYAGREFPGGGWETVAQQLPIEKPVPDWDAAERWAKENFKTVRTLLTDHFFQDVEKEKGRYFVSVSDRNGTNYLRFECKDS